MVNQGGKGKRGKKRRNQPKVPFERRKKRAVICMILRGEKLHASPLLQERGGGRVVGMAS